MKSGEEASFASFAEIGLRRLLRNFKCLINKGLRSCETKFREDAKKGVAKCLKTKAAKLRNFPPTT
jgi:hypothetical protein